ncbi:MAG: RNA methyltransferase [Myxococcales bacterium]|nr:RNA methyltransferase [Myxococcales bacterium]HIK84696.1 RNA methyltransferase [Myxococcales bacterium]
MTRRDLHRGETLVTVFGHHPVREALRSKGAEVLELRLVAGSGAKEYRELRHDATTLGIAVAEISRTEMNAYTGAPRHDQGIGARVRLLRVIETEIFLENLKGKNAGRPARVMALDGVTNSQNVGMVVRSVVGAGLSGMLWPMVGQPWINGLLIRAAAGSIFECPIIRCDSLVLGLAAFQSAGFSCLGLDSDAPSSLFSMLPTHREVYVLGSESAGMSDEIQSLVDVRVSIPMAGALESLNVAVAAGLVCFHAGGLLSPEG